MERKGLIDFKLGKDGFVTIKQITKINSLDESIVLRKKLLDIKENSFDFSDILTQMYPFVSLVPQEIY